MYKYRVSLIVIWILVVRVLIGLKVLVAGKVSPLLSVFLLNIPGATFNTGRALMQ